jgi:SpoVK/Ycf46/Vps4 family AAA+-type ATPase
VHNLAGLTYSDTAQLARNAIFVDGAITKSDLPGVMDSKYALLNRGGTLHFEYDTARFSDIGGMERLKRWLTQRKSVFRGDEEAAHLDVPKGILLLGVQGCGKSLAAKATAAIFGVPLLRLDFGNIYDKYHGETERKLRESLRTADVMSPCVLWIDELEKGIAGRGGETGTTQRVLGSFLAWLSEKQSRVFVVATANDISALPAELVRKGRFDEIFFVDLPDRSARTTILEIHLAKRQQRVESFDVEKITAATDGFSGAEIEQAVVAALYAAHSQARPLTSEHILAEIDQTRPLSVVMYEQIKTLRQWADGRTVSCS